MPINAIALLRTSGVTTPGLAGVRVEVLEDAVLVHTGMDFADEPEVLSSAVRALAGEALVTAHDDPRGVFFIPDVVPLTGRSYDAIVEEVAEGGVWGPSPLSIPPLSAAAAAGGLDALLGGMLGQLPGGLVAAASAAAADPAVMQQASGALKGLLDNPDQLKALAGTHLPGLNNLLAGSGIDLSSPDLRALAESMQQQLQQNPAQLAELAERLFGEAREGDKDEEED